jgi:hypothetical protein
MKRNSNAYKALCLLLAICGIAFAAWKMYDPSTGPDDPYSLPVPPIVRPPRANNASVNPGIESVRSPSPRQSTSSAETQPRPQRKADTRPSRPMGGTNADADFGTLVYKDANGALIEGVTASYLPPPFDFELFRNFNQPPSNVELSSLTPPSPWVLFKHPRFEVVGSIRNLKLLKENENDIILPVVLGDDARKIAISGRIIDNAGKGVPQAMVWMKSPTESRDLPAPAMWVRTDDDGRFNIALREITGDLPPTFTLAIAPNSRLGPFPQVVTATPGEPLTVTLKQLPARQVTLSDENGKPFTVPDEKKDEKKNAKPSVRQHVWLERRNDANTRLSMIYFPGAGQYPLDDGLYCATYGYYKSVWIKVSGAESGPIDFKLLPPAGGMDPFGKPYFPLDVKLLFRDEFDRPLANLPIYFKKTGDSKWDFSGVTDSLGYDDVTFKTPGEYAMCVSFSGDVNKDPSVPFATLTIAPKAYTRPINVRIPFDAQVPLMLKTAGNVVFRDALGKLMPAGTQVILTGGKPATLVLDASGTLESHKFADGYEPGFRVSHYDYGTACVTGMRKDNNTVVVQVPLISVTDAKTDPLVFTGQCLAPDGAGAPDVRVASCLNFASPGAARTAKSGPAFVITNSDGTYTYRPILDSAATQNTLGQINSGASMLIFLLPEGRHYLPHQTAAKPKSPIKSKLQNADRQLTLAFTDNDGKPASPLEFETVLTSPTGQIIFSMPPGWIPPSGAIALAPGQYTFKHLAKGYETNLQVTSTTPANVTLPPYSPITITSRVLDMDTGKPIAGAIIVATRLEDAAVDAGAVAPEKWQGLQQLQEPFNLHDLPSPLGSDLKAIKGAVTNDAGKFAIKGGSAFGPSRTLILHVVKEGYLPAACRVECPAGFTNGNLDIPTILLPLSAILDLDFATQPGDLQPEFKGETPCVLFSSFTLPIQDAIENSSVTTVSYNLPPQLPLGKRKLVIPANVPVRLIVRRANTTFYGQSGALASFHMPDGPVTLKPGETKPLTLARVPVINWPVTVLMPDGTRMDDPPILVCAFEDSNQWLPINTGPAGQNGSLNIPWYTGKPLEITLALDPRSQDNPRFTFPARDKVPDDPTVIRITQQQLETLRPSSQTR